MKTAFIGHREIFDKNIRKKLELAIEIEIKKGCRFFTMGTHGEFDKLALNICREMRVIYPEIKIEVVITSLNNMKKDSMIYPHPYEDVELIMYDIENAHFKQRITLSNRQMIEHCNTLICYVDKSVNRSGAKNTLLYAEKLGMKIINLY